LPPPLRGTSRRAPRTNHVRLLIALGTIAAIASTFLGNEALFAVGFLFVISWPLERWWKRHPVPIRRLGLRTDLTYAIAAPALQAAGLAVAVVVGVLSLAWLPGLALRPLVTSMPAWAQAVAGFLLFDMLAYWTHRWSHTVGLFWRFHSVHHSTRHLDWVSGFRAHPLDGVFMAPVFAFVLGAGFNVEVVGTLAVLQFIVGVWSHLNVRWRLRPLRAIILTPDFHHWHHSNYPETWHTNFSIFLPIWDVMFGTFHMPADRRPEVYGVDDPVPLGIVGQLLYPFRRRRPDTL
jgi:sterol desaturase/sphingolipid hydroxylase (fatty acid hydroxylase superfamily)